MCLYVCLPIFTCFNVLFSGPGVVGYPFPDNFGSTCAAFCRNILYSMDGTMESCQNATSLYGQPGCLCRDVSFTGAPPSHPRHTQLPCPPPLRRCQRRSQFPRPPRSLRKKHRSWRWLAAPFGLVRGAKGSSAPSTDSACNQGAQRLAWYEPSLLGSYCLKT